MDYKEKLKSFLTIRSAQGLLLVTWLAVVLLQVFVTTTYAFLGPAAWVAHLALAIALYWALRSSAIKMDQKLKKVDSEDE